jgi:hypothetical protein
VPIIYNGTLKPERGLRGKPGVANVSLPWHP